MTQNYKCSKEVSKASLALEKFDDLVLKPYLEGKGEHDVKADELAARSLIPAGTAAKRSFAAVSPYIPVYDPSKCIACL